MSVDGRLENVTARSLVTTMAIKKRNLNSRLPLAIALICASFLSAFALAAFSNHGKGYWVAKTALRAGHQISTEDVQLRSLTLQASSTNYLGKAQNPIGLIVIRKLEADEIISQSSVGDNSESLLSDAVPISVRSADLADGIVIGESIDIYWVQDRRNGELVSDPILILGGVSLLGFDKSGKNFGSDIALTVAVEKTQVLRLLNATTRGRLVIVKSNV